jgi:hypothetical protein
MFYKLLRILETTSLHTGTEKLRKKKSAPNIFLNCRLNSPTLPSPLTTGTGALVELTLTSPPPLRPDHGRSGARGTTQPLPPLEEFLHARLVSLPSRTSVHVS